MDREPANGANDGDSRPRRAVKAAQPASSKEGTEDEHEDVEDGAGPGPSSMHKRQEGKGLQDWARKPLADKSNKSYATYQKQFKVWASSNKHDLEQLDSKQVGELGAQFMRHLLTTKKSGLSVLKMARCSIRDLLAARMQRRGEPASSLADAQRPMVQEVAAAKAREEAEGKPRPAAVDPLVRAMSGVYTNEQYAKMCNTLASQTSAPAAAQLVWLTLLHGALGPSGDSRLLYVCDMCRPEQLTSVGPSPCLAFSMVVNGNKKGQKTQAQGGRSDCIEFVRAANPAQCPVRALGQQLHALYTVQGKVYRNPVMTQDWRSDPLFPVAKHRDEVSAETQLRMMGQVLTDAGVQLAKKSHAMRARADTCTLDLQGAAGGMPITRIRVLLAKAGFNAERPVDQMFWAERFAVTISAEAQEQLTCHLFPFLPALRERVKQVGDAAKDKQLALSPSPACNLAALEALALVLVQDSLDMAASHPSNPVVRHLMMCPRFVQLHGEYAANKAAGVYKASAPQTVSEQLREMKQLLDRMLQMQNALERGSGAHEATAAMAPLQAGLTQLAAGMAAPTADEQAGRRAGQPLQREQQPGPTGGPQQQEGKQARGRAEPEPEREPWRAVPGLEKLPPGTNPINAVGMTSLAQVHEAHAVGRPGFPAWQQLEADHGLKWRSGNSNLKRRWSDLQVFFRAIDATQAALDLPTKAAAAQELDSIRVKYGYSLDAMRTWLLQQEREPGGLAAIMQQRSAKSLPTPQKGPRRPARPPQPAPAGTNTALASAEEAAAAAARSADQHTNKRTGIVAMGGVAQPVQKRARRACGYNLFVADVISRHREQGTGKKTITLAGKLWREAGPEVQAQFNAKARAEEGGGA